MIVLMGYITHYGILSVPSSVIPSSSVWRAFKSKTNRGDYSSGSRKNSLSAIFPGKNKNEAELAELSRFNSDR